MGANSASLLIFPPKVLSPPREEGLPLPLPPSLTMASRRGNGDDLWAEITSEEEKPQPNAQIGVVYGRRRPEDTNPGNVQIARSGRENRVCFAPGLRPSWNRSLSTRGRESIFVAVELNEHRQPKQIGAKKKPKQGLRSKKTAQGPPDFMKEKAYFQEVDSFELLEESPSPKYFGSWVFTQHDYVVHDLPAILERWKLSKLDHRCGPSGPLAKIMETPTIGSGQSSNNVSGIMSERTPERALGSRLPLNFTSYRSSIIPSPANPNLTGNVNCNSIVTSFNALKIKEEAVEGDTCDDSAEGDVVKELEGTIKKVSMAPHSTSLGEDCLSAFAQLLMVCQQSCPVRLSEAFSMYCEPSGIIKIGEGTYGEAFRTGDAVCKIVPIDGDQLVNGEVQKKSDEVLEEVMLSLTLNSLREQQGEKNKQNACTSFIESKDFRVCQGAYDAGLISAWEVWDAKNGSENDHPKEFPEEQCYIVFVLADGGRDLESFLLLNFDEARSLLMQVTAALAVAEAACEFEHRDLHWGNILVTRKETTSMNFILQGRKFSAKTFGLSISIIDFTLSRINTGEAILFLDLSADPGLFEGPKGDKQADTYRKMKEVTEECWEGSFPKTNVLWLIYLVDILLTKKSFKRAARDERDLRSFKKRLASYDSAQDSLSDSLFSDLLVDHRL